MGGSVLIVDEDGARRRALHVALESIGVVAFDVDDALPALVALEQVPFQAIIVSGTRPSLSLSSLFRYARRRQPSIHAFVVGGRESGGAQALDVSDVGRAAHFVAESLLHEPLPHLELDDAPLLEGALDGGVGPALLIGLFAQELTGRLLVGPGALADVGSATRLHVHRGEPVWIEDDEGDAGCYRRLVERGYLPPDATIKPVPDGELLRSLVDNGVLSGDKAIKFMKERVREGVLAVAGSVSNHYRFEERAPVDEAPPVRVNPFGLLLESRRRVMTPDRVHVIGMELEHKFMVPGPAAGVMSERLQPFLRGMRLAELADGTRDVRQFCDATSLDLMMGTLVVLTLLDGRLIRLEDTPLPPPSIPDLHLELIDEGAMPTPTSDAAQA